MVIYVPNRPLGRGAVMGLVSHDNPIARRTLMLAAKKFPLARSLTNAVD